MKGVLYLRACFPSDVYKFQRMKSTCEVDGKVFSCSCRFVFTRGAAEQPAALTQQTVAVLTFPIFVLQTDQICDVTYFYYLFSGFFLKCCYSTFIYVLRINYNTINFMLNSYFKQIEEFTYTVPTETCCPRLLVARGCLRLSCECRFVNLQYHFLPAVSVLIRCVRKLF